MKKAILLVCGLFVAVATQAQDKKMWLGGTMSINSTTPDKEADTKISTMTFGPQFGYWINENLAVGINLTLSGTTTKDGFEDAIITVLAYDEKKENTTFISPFVRYYKGLGDNFKLYGELNFGFGSGKTSWDGVTDENGDVVKVDDQKFSAMNIGVGPGIQYWFNDNWSMNAYAGVLGYSSSTLKDGTVDKNGDVVDLTSSSIDLNLDFSALSFGLNFHF